MRRTQAARALIAFGCSATLALGTGWAQVAVAHSPWDALLQRHVHGGRADYPSFQRARNELERYLATLATINPDDLHSKQAQAAFWINAYNACVIKGVLEHYPLTSVRKVKGFFDRIRYQVAGQALTLNEIEAKGRALGDWRIHVALVCASSSCPLLRSEAYVPERLDDQLSDQAKQFFRDASRGLLLDAARHTLWVSKIVRWHATDFIPSGKLTAEGLLPILRPYLDPAMLLSTHHQKLTLKFLDYDWSLNRQKESN